MAVKIGKNSTLTDCSINLKGFAWGYLAVYLFEFALNSIAEMFRFLIGKTLV